MITFYDQSWLVSQLVYLYFQCSHFQLNISPVFLNANKYKLTVTRLLYREQIGADNRRTWASDSFHYHQYTVSPAKRKSVLGMLVE